ncbi:hypothetical protein LTS18_003275 [Coniosporium uncinatum]|uniref:Uncharacterized protein n=1 Tax=Coniosporium uncinatum TaxID=93489 RepID=A0ACC3D708_9PEZI|nr:hypothetical protein LTS18_003275 [Coniosporium uncinatum]
MSRSPAFLTLLQTPGLPPASSSSFADGDLGGGSIPLEDPPRYEGEGVADFGHEEADLGEAPPYTSPVRTRAPELPASSSSSASFSTQRHAQATGPGPGVGRMSTIMSVASTPDAPGSGFGSGSGSGSGVHRTPTSARQASGIPQLPRLAAMPSIEIEMASPISPVRSPGEGRR